MLGTMILSLAVLQQPTAAEQAANLFLVAGLASPAGGEYRRVTIKLPLIVFGERQININAWVVEDSLTGVRHVVAWNGLSYAPVTIGETADLEADVTRGRAINERFLGMESAEYHASFTTTGPAAGAMLQLYGRPDLAERVVTTPFFMVTTSANPRVAAATMADRILCDAAVARIIYAQDWEALLLCRRVRRFRSVLEGVLQADGSVQGSFNRAVDRSVIDSWIENLNMRISEPSKLPTSSQLARMPREKRIATLVKHLDESAAAHAYIIGEEPPILDGPAYRLVNEGDAGIDALIGALEDTRMTRAVFGNGLPMYPYHFSTVGEVAGRLLESAMGMSGFSQDPVKRHAEIRSFWTQARGKPKEERWLIALEDDDLPPYVWLNAALALSVPSWINPSGTGTVSGTGGLPQHFTGPSIKWPALFEKRRDRVYAALERRARQLSIEARYSVYAHRMIVSAAVWDLQRAIPMLQLEKEKVLSEARNRKEGPDGSDLGRLSDVVSPLVFAGVADAWKGYEELLDVVKLNRRSSSMDDILAPLWQHPDDPVARRIAERIFKGSGPWSAAYNTSESFGSFTSVFIYLPAFQQGLADGLRDKSAAVTATRYSATAIRYPTFGPGSGTDGATIAANTASIEIGGEIELRRCDLLMEKLKKRFGFNTFDLALSIKDRDMWIDRAQQLMAQENFNWPGEPMPSLFITDPVFISRAIWPNPMSRIRPGTFRRGG